MGKGIVVIYVVSGLIALAAAITVSIILYRIKLHNRGSGARHRHPEQLRRTRRDVVNLEEILETVDLTKYLQRKSAERVG